MDDRDRYSLYCGQCREMFTVHIDDIPDGEIWLCRVCQSRAASEPIAAPNPNAKAENERAI